VFIEWFNSNLNGFGSDKMQVGTSTWVIGLNLEI
jgi:hypothetical protein